MLVARLDAAVGEDIGDAVVAADTGVDDDSTTGVGSSFTLAVPLVVTAGFATEYGDVDGALEASSMPS